MFIAEIYTFFRLIFHNLTQEIGKNESFGYLGIV